MPRRVKQPFVARTVVSPPKLAKRWGIDPEKVLGWVRSGELKAFDASAVQGGRPRYLIDEADIADFVRRRTVSATPKSVIRRPRRPTGATEYF